MFARFRYIAVILLIAGAALGCGSGSNEVVVEAPSEAERQAELEKMTPEQREAIEAMSQAIQSQIQESSEQQSQSQ